MKAQATSVHGEEVERREGGALSIVEAYKKLKGLLQYMVQRYYPSLGGRLWVEVYKRLGKAYRLYLDNKRYEVKRSAGKTGVALIWSTEALEKGIEHHIVLYSLTGERVVVERGTPIERAFHKVEVSPARLKCTCNDALMTSSIADKQFRMIARKFKGYTPRQVFYRYTLCKHTLAEVLRGLVEGRLEFSDRVLRDTLFLALYGLALRYVPATSIPFHTHRKAITILTSRRELL